MRCLILLAELVLVLSIGLGSGGFAGCSSSGGRADAATDSDGAAADTAGDPGLNGDLDQGVPCGPDGACVAGALCCDGFCSNPFYDPLNCGGCGKPCTSDQPYCVNNICSQAPCSVKCDSRPMCCNNNCCQTGQVCCVVSQGPVTGPACYWSHCPPGCPTCK